MYLSSNHLADIGLPVDAGDLAAPVMTGFSDGTQVRFEIPSVEGPRALEAVIDAAAEHRLPVHRVSQGSGIWMLTDSEITAMVDLGREHGIEVVLFVGPRDSWSTGRQALSSSGAVSAGTVAGAHGLAAGTDEALRAAALGVDGVLVADLGLLMVLGKLKARGVLPAHFALKVSVSLPVANPATAQVLEDLGATSLNLSVDLSVESIAAIRQAVDIPLDMYIEASDDFGGGMRYYDIPALVDAGAPAYLKFTVRNAPHTYPSGGHLQAAVEALAAERVRRAALGLALLRRYRPEVRVSAAGAGITHHAGDPVAASAER